MKHQRISLVIGAGMMGALALWCGFPLWLAALFGPAFVIAFFALGYFLHGGGPGGFWRALIDE